VGHHCCNQRPRTPRTEASLIFISSLAAALLAVAAPLRAQDLPPPSPAGNGQSTAADTQPPAEEPRPGLVSAGANLTVGSAFVWRGFVLGSDPVVQPTAWLKVGPVTVSSWSNLYVPSSGGMVRSEHDLTVDYSTEVRGVSLSAGWINYAYAHVASGRFSNEFYGSVGVGGFLNPKLQVYQDVNEGSGTYASLAVSHEFALPWGAMTLTPSLSVGYNHHLWTDYAGFSDVTPSVTLNLSTPIPRLSLQPFLGYSCGLETSVFPRRFYGGVALVLE
jgi:hypothetical protein